MKNLLTKLRYVPKHFGAIAALTLAVATPAVLLAWGPDRPTFTIDDPAGYVTFNSITDNPAHGDERNFVQVKAADAPNSSYAESVDLQAGKEYTVFVYYHNNAASNLNASGKGIAKDAYVRAEVPAVVNGSADVVGFVGASNAKPTRVWDEATFKSDSAMALRMVPGSATIYSKGAVDGAKLPDSIITTGAPLGYDALNGKVPGCEEFAGYVTFKVKADQPNFTVEKKVSKYGANSWVENYSAQPGETVDYLINYRNTGTTQQNNVVVKDELPAGMSYVNGSTVYGNSKNPNGTEASDNVTKGGINVGSYAPGANAWVIFSAKVASKEDLECEQTTLRNVARVETNNGSKEDDAKVTVPAKECQPEEPKECKPGIPVGDERCEDQPEVPEVPENPETPEKPKEETPEVPKVLPSTGPAALLGGLFGSSALGLGVHSFLNSRRALRDALNR